MNLRFLTTTGTLLLAAALPLLAQAASVKPVGTDGKLPDIEILERIFDAGEVQKGDPIVHEFKVKNKGEAPLQIFNARASCGCTVTEYDKTIMPGESGRVGATIKTTNLRSGPTTKSVTITSNDPDEKQIILQIKGTLVSLADAIPSNVYLRTDRINRAPSYFLVRPHEKNPFKVKGVTSDLDFLSFDVKEVKDTSQVPPEANVRPRKGDFLITAKVGENAPIGEVTGNITALTTSEITPQVKISVRGSITGLITAIPRRVYIRISSPQTFVTPTKDVLKVRRQPSPESPEVGEVKKGDRLQVMPKAANLDGAADWERVRTPDRRIGFVLAKFTEKIEPDVRAQPALSNTRTVQVRKSQGEPFKMKNVNCTIDGVSVETSTVEDGRAYSVTLTYDGELGRGAHQGELVIMTTDKEEPTVKVPVFVQIS
jgi:hypothetical protein